jgi:hypothetical protein
VFYRRVDVHGREQVPRATCDLRSQPLSALADVAVTSQSARLSALPCGIQLVEATVSTLFNGRRARSSEAATHQARTTTCNVRRVPERPPRRTS